MSETEISPGMLVVVRPDFYKFPVYGVVVEVGKEDTSVFYYDRLSNADAVHKFRNSKIADAGEPTKIYMEQNSGYLANPFKVRESARLAEQV